MVVFTFEYPHGRREIIHPSRGAQSGDDDGGRGHEIVRKCVVQIALQLENILDLVELFLISGRPRSEVSWGFFLFWFPLFIAIPSLPFLREKHGKAEGAGWIYRALNSSKLSS